MKSMLITLMFLVVAKKSRTFFGFPCSAHEQVCRSWAGAQPGSESQLASGNIPYHGRHAQVMSGSWLGAEIHLNPLLSGNSNPLLSVSSKFSRSLVFFGSFAKFIKSMSSGFHDRCSGTDCKLVIVW